MALPLIPIVKGGLSLLGRRALSKAAKRQRRMRILEKIPPGDERARAYGKLTGRNFKGYDIDPVTRNAIATYHKPIIGGFEKGLAVGAGAVTLAMPEYKPQPVKIKPTKNQDSLLQYNKRIKPKKFR